MPFWPPKWSPRGTPELRESALGGIQDGHEIVLVRFSCRLVVRGRFFGRLGVVLGSFLGAPGVVLVLFRHFNPSIQPINSSIRPFNPSTHRPMALRHFLTRPGGLRAARLIIRKLSTKKVSPLVSRCSIVVRGCGSFFLKFSL